jgi:conjugative transfer signal peptidase TraF
MTRFGWVMATYFATLLIGVSALFHPSPKLIWNASASVPIGFYSVQRGSTLMDGDLVVVSPPMPLASFLAARRYLPRGVPLLKHVAALTKQIVCRHGVVVTIDGVAVASALTRDRAGRSLPVWQGCRTLTAREIFLLNPTVPDSLDGRYFGPLPMASVIGRAVPLWTFKEP